MPNADQAELFEDDGVTPIKKADDKPAITAAELKASERAARAEGKAAALEAVVSAKPAAPKTEAKDFTRAELRAQVNDGKITEDDMDTILERQLEARLTKKANEVAESKIAASQTGAKVGDQIAAYVGVFPAINETESPLRAKIEAEFQDLVKNGSPNALSTELAAIKIICGPLKTGAGRRPAPDAHEDVGSGNDGDGKPVTDGWAKGLSPKMKKHYEKAIDRGIYKGHADPRLVAELKLARGRPN